MSYVDTFLNEMLKYWRTTIHFVVFVRQPYQYLQWSKKRKKVLLILLKFKNKLKETNKSLFLIFKDLEIQIYIIFIQ
jgi:hypothetical protein